MGLSRGWCGLVLFWAGIVTLGGVGAVTLEVLGPPPATVDSERADRVGPTQAVPSEAISYSPATSAPRIAQVTPEPTPVVAPEISVGADGSGPEDTQVEAASPPSLPETGTDAKMMVASETIAAPDKKDNVRLTPVSRDILSESGVAAVANAVDEASEVAPQNTDRAKKKLHLRIARDKHHCGQAACLTWHLVKRQAGAPRAARIDLARLNLAPDLRAAAENGSVELIVDAVERHETIKGRDIVILVATDLTGVRPRERPL